MGMGIQPPFPVSMETRTLPLFAQLVAPGLFYKIFPCSPGLGTVLDRFFSLDSSRVLRSHSSLAILKPGRVCFGQLVSALPPNVPGQPIGPSVLLSLLSEAAKCASVGLRKPEQGVGPVLPGSDPLTGNYLSVCHPAT